MKKILLTLLSFTLLACTANDEQPEVAEWRVVGENTSGKLETIAFVDSNLGYCSGAFNKTFYTEDGGETWKKRNDFGIKSIDFHSNIGFGSAPLGEIFYTNDSGETWRMIEAPMTNSLWGVAVLDNSSSIFTGTGGVIWKTSNSGNSLSRMNFPLVSTDITDVDFPNALTGFLSAQNEGIWKSTDGGQTWANMLREPGMTFFEISFPNEYVGYAVGAAFSTEERLMKTSDGGSSWERLNTNNNSILWGVDFYDPAHGIAVGYGGTILYTSDGGETWRREESGTTERLLDVVMLSPNKAIVVGESGTILKNSNISY